MNFIEKIKQIKEAKEAASPNVQSSQRQAENPNRTRINARLEELKTKFNA